LLSQRPARFCDRVLKTLLLTGVASIGICALDSSISSAAAAKKHPNILYIVADDLGYSDLHAFGGEINTPNLDELAAKGTIFTNFHTSPVCAVTRSMMYSGADHHLVGLGTMGAPSNEQKGLPGYEGYLNDRALSVAQLLHDGGYHTYIAGKWHLGSNIALGQTPFSWGFERSYVLLGGATANHFGHEAANSQNYAYDGKYVQPGQPGQPGGDGSSFYDTDFYTQKLISFIDSNRSDGKPFLAFATYTSPHWPLQVPQPYLSKYRGIYSAGYSPIRNKRLQRLKELGIIPPNLVPFAGRSESLAASSPTANYGTANAKYINAINPNPPVGDPSYVDYGPGYADPLWASLTPAQQQTQARYMEIYAGMVENLDHNVGLLIQHLKDIGEYDNTFIIFHSDNGAEGWPLTAAQETLNEQPANFALLGQSGSNVQYGLRWAEVSATPLNLIKGYTGEGGVSVPAIVHLPGQSRRYATVRDFIHIRDSAPTLLALAGIAPPTTPAPPLVNANGIDQNAGKVVYDGRYVYPLSGVSFLNELYDAGRHHLFSSVSLNEWLEWPTSQPLHKEAVGEELYGRTYLHKGEWKAIFTEPPIGPLDGHWQLFNVKSDRGETNDVSAKNQALLQSLIKDWTSYMKHVGGVERLQPKGYY
jgi:arylsulfatase